MPQLVFDTTCLSHFARADRLDVLGELVVGYQCMTTNIVEDELRRGTAEFPAIGDALDLEWLQVVRLSTDEELLCFARWMRRLSAGPRHLGETSVFALVELRQGIAITDDAGARRVGRRGGLEVHGTIWLLAESCRSGKLTETATGSIIEALRDTDMRLPCTGAEFPSFARLHGLL